MPGSILYRELVDPRKGHHVIVGKEEQRKHTPALPLDKIQVDAMI